MTQRACILMPTTQRYLNAARLSIKLIAQHWPEHPQIFLCGAVAEEPNMLPLAHEPSNWMGIVGSAARELQARGYTRAYLILDDQGPTAACHSQHLNDTIPNWMTQLDAVYVSIRGWDQRRNSSGDHLGPSFKFLQKQAPSYPWKFALHPALWRLDVLIGIVDALTGPHGCPGKSAWDFEREAGLMAHLLPPEWNHSTYRVCGRAMSMTPQPVQRRMLLHLRDRVLRDLHMFVSRPVFRGHKWSGSFAKLTTAVLRSDDVMYDGPYPMPYSGFLVKGELNVHLLRRLRRAGNEGLVRELTAAAPSK